MAEKMHARSHYWKKASLKFIVKSGLPTTVTAQQKRKFHPLRSARQTHQEYTPDGSK
ncbi:hypothetical protein SAMN05428952_1001128 [Nitrosomonas sp. Nm132]|nr:hypothetical protein SAMN05428952_1001128 [Nitrosomonas sp. Nm132]